MTKDYELAVFIGRMQIPHVGHISVVRKALEIADHALIIIGSANTPRSHRNPFTVIERVKMLESSFTAEELARIRFAAVEDVAYNDTAWIESIQRVVAETATKLNLVNPDITLIGHSKDASSYYLKLFPQWASTNVENVTGLSSTPMRQAYFSNIGHLWLADCDGHNVGDNAAQKLVTSGVKEFLEKFIKTEGYKYIVNEYEHITEYYRQWINSPYPPTFVTADALVEISGHILLVKRRAAPGKGLLALPGGFVNNNELIRDAVFRELREETGIKVPEAVLRGSVVNKDVFDDPNRSSRGRTITHCYHVKLANDVKLPRVKGGDDAETASWYPIHKIRRDQMFEDHYDIIQYFLGKAKTK